MSRPEAAFHYTGMKNHLTSELRVEIPPGRPRSPAIEGWAQTLQIPEPLTNQVWQYGVTE